MAGRLGVLRRLEGEGGSWPVPLSVAKAESLRSSSENKVLLRALALGPGEVRGRRTLLSQPREVGPVDGARFAFEGVVGER